MKSKILHFKISLKSFLPYIVILKHKLLIIKRLYERPCKYNQDKLIIVSLSTRFTHNWS